MLSSRGCRTTLAAVAVLLVAVVPAGCGRVGVGASSAPSEATSGVGAGSLAEADPTAQVTSATPSLGSASTNAPGSAPGYSDLFPSIAATIATARAARVRGRMAEGGQSVALDASGNTAGSDALSYVTDAAGTLTVLQVAGTTYVRATKAYWAKQIGNRAAKVVGSAWVPMPAKTPLGDVTVGALLRRAVDTAPTDADLRDSTVTRTTVGDLSAYAVTSPDGLRTLYVSAGTRAYPLRYVERAGADPASAAQSGSGAPASTASASPGQPGGDSTLPVAGADPTLPVAGADPTRSAAGTTPGSGGAAVVTDLTFTDWNAVATHRPPPARAVLPAS